MARLSATSVASLLVSLIMAGTLAAQDSDSAAVAAAVSAFHDALVAGQPDAVMELLAPEAVVLESGGKETRMEYQAGHLAADIDYAQTATRTRGDVEVQVVGDVAWAVSVSQSKYQDRSSQSAELMVLRRHGDKWLISAIHWSSRRSRE